MRGGPAAMLFRGARGLELKDAQKSAIDKAEATLKPDADHPKSEMKDLHADLVAGVKAGKIDAAKLDARFTAIQKAIQAQQEKQADALNALWAALEPLQRRVIVADIRTKRAEREDLEKRQGDAGAFNVAEWNKRRIDRLTQDLDLDDAQQQKVSAFFAKQAPPPDIRGEMKKSMEALLAAFDSDAFDAKKLEPFGGQSASKARAPLENEVKFLADLVPALKPEQRDKLAAKLDASGSRPGPMMGGHDGPDAPHVWPFPFEPGAGDKNSGNAPLGAKIPPRR
jgi:Spy/CpxP family protein refolding chaperone